MDSVEGIIALNARAVGKPKSTWQIEVVAGKNA